VPQQLLKGFVATSLVAAGLLVPMTFASGSTTIPTTSTGFDISYPQCGGAFPSPAGFGIVGLNDGHPMTTNPCLASELGWAQATANATPSFYFNTDAPGPAYTSAWPTSQQTPEACSGANTPACSYDYGWNAALYSFNNAVTAETDVGSTSPNTQAIAATWWLDVETGNHWETLESQYGPSAASQAIDQAMLQGSIAYLVSVGITSIGIYSTSRQWGTITGGAPTAFSTWQAWMPGYASLAAAQVACTTPSFNGGRVAMIQYPSRGLDGDYVCGLVSTPTSASIPVSATPTFTQQLNAADNQGTVSYVQTTGSPDLTVSSTGLMATNGTLAKGSYVATGTLSDTGGHSGTFSFTLLVGSILQSSTTTAVSSSAGSATFTSQVAATGGVGPVTYAETSGSPTLLVSPTGVITTDGVLASGTYSVKGTMNDASGDSGTFHLSLSVGTLTQSLPTNVTVTDLAASTYSDQLAVTGAGGPVTFVQTTGTPSLVVSSLGVLTTDGTLVAGSYVARGTTSDTSGDTGTFFFNLKVTATSTTTTTTTSTTTTTVPTGPVASRVIGHAVAGRTVTLAIAGSGFYGRPTVTSHTGTVVTVLRDTGTTLVTRVKAKAGSRSGTFTFTITLADHVQCHVKYIQR
jgi:hypothetical protein